jgi:para-aminobenzoate synthetase component 1
LNLNDFEKTLNTWGASRIPFLFIVDFEMKKPLAFKLQDINCEEIVFNINGFTNAGRQTDYIRIDTSLTKNSIPFEEYHIRFSKVFDRLEQGDSYLTNLTIKTQIGLRATLRELFHASNAKYKLHFKNEFLVFSPEIFIQIRDNKIYSFPMKGTIDASIPHADKIILANNKELAEHVTIVDLIRNDLSQIADNVQVSRFRYLEEIKTNQKHLFQVSSEIVGSITEPFSKIGTLLTKLLPAGSVSGAPKVKTISIIKDVEGESRGYYTGVVGIFDGQTLDSGVMIRFIEQQNDKIFYRSGGGITTQSNSKAEFEEAIDKIYVPVN